MNFEVQKLESNSSKMWRKSRKMVESHVISRQGPQHFIVEKDFVQTTHDVLFYLRKKRFYILNV